MALLIPTIAIHSTKHPSGRVLINLSTFDPTIHTAYYDAEGNPTPAPKTVTVTGHPDAVASLAGATLEDGQGGTVTMAPPALEEQDDPVPDSPAAFERMNAKDAIHFVKGLTLTEPLEALARIEEAGKNRVSVLEAIDKRRAELEG